MSAALDTSLRLSACLIDCLAVLVGAVRDNLATNVLLREDSAPSRRWPRRWACAVPCPTQCWPDSLPPIAMRRWTPCPVGAYGYGTSPAGAQPAMCPRGSGTE